MKNLNLATGRIWSFSDETGDTIRLSLSEILLSDIQLEHSPAFGYLAPLQHELLASILQCCVDSIWPKGISKKNYELLVQCREVQSIYPLVEKICNQLQKIKGFCLVGNSAFLQMPAAWKNNGKKIHLSRLMWPFIPNTHKISQAKGIRRMAPVPQKLGPDLAALFLFASCTLPKGGASYWTIGNLAGRAILHGRFGKTLRQQLFSSVLPGYSPHWKRMQPLPWVASCLNNGGLEENSKPPFLQYITGNKKLSGTVNSRFFQARGIVLDPPENGVCDVTGEQTQVFTTYRLFDDNAILEQILRCTRTKKKIKAANILGKMYGRKNSPSVAIGESTVKRNIDNNTSKLPYHGYSIPSWAIMGKTHSFPSHIIQAHTASNDLICQEGEYCWSCFQIKYAPEQQDPKGLFMYHCPSSMTFDAFTMEQVVNLTKAVEESIEKIRSGMKQLYSGPQRKKKHKANISKLLEQHILGISQRFWSVADQLHHELITKKQDIDIWQSEVTTSLYRCMYNCWNYFVTDDWESRPMSLQDYQHFYRATCTVLGDNYMDYDRSYLEANPVVRAGRAFAEAFFQLDPSQQSQLLNENAPYISRYFWVCMQKAKHEDPHAYQPGYEQALPLLTYIQPVHDEKSFGRILARQKHHINSRRIKLLFSEEDSDMLFDMLLQLFHLISSKNGRSVRVDFGLLVFDLKQFHFQPSAVLRRWATDYFSYSIMNHQQEEAYVQA